METKLAITEEAITVDGLGVILQGLAMLDVKVLSPGAILGVLIYLSGVKCHEINKISHCADVRRLHLLKARRRGRDFK
jgi:hypothetical protein